VSGLDLTELPAWFGRAACLGLPQVLGRDPWFPTSSETSAAAEAVAICGACPVQVDCLDHALEHGVREGVWGGLTPQQRGVLTRTAAG
jgi:WhiB family transcriptional regulator, redox-sensing transcriptional regulator